MLRVPRQTANDNTNSASSSASPSTSASASESSNAASSTDSESSSAPSSVSSKPPTSKPTVPPTSVPPTSTPNANSTISQSAAPSSSSDAAITNSSAPPPQGSQSPALGNSDSSSPLFLAPDSTTIPAPNLTTIVTMINGQSTTFTSVLPTNLATGSPNSSSGNSRTAIIAGTTAAAGGLLICALVLVFVVRKVQLRKAIADALKDHGAKREGRGLLEDEGFDDDPNYPPVRSAYSTYSSIGAGARVGSVARSGSPALGHLKTRTSETGSIFREEVWPPPGFVDPISKQTSQVDLSKIVDEVMGPAASSSSENMHETGHSRGPTDASAISGHTSSHSHGSLNSNTGLLHTSTISHSDPFASSSSQGSVYYPTSHAHAGARPTPGQLPPGALPPAVPGLIVTRASPPTTIQSSSQISATTRAATQPKKSSPLARALSKDARLFTGGRP